MKFLRVQITDHLHTRLKALTTHHGELSHLVRRAIREYLDRMEEDNNAKLRTQSTPHSKVETSTHSASAEYLIHDPARNR